LSNYVKISQILNSAVAVLPALPPSLPGRTAGGEGPLEREGGTAPPPPKIVNFYKN